LLTILFAVFCAVSDLADRKQAAAEALARLRAFHKIITAQMAEEITSLHDQIDEVCASSARAAARESAVAAERAASNAGDALKHTRSQAAFELHEMRQQLRKVTGSADGVLAAAHEQLADLTRCIEEEHVQLQTRIKASTGAEYAANAGYLPWCRLHA
jgi:ElaB/YqjD/DUF883 family membrane-anchored ribosome-binding protein